VDFLENIAAHGLGHVLCIGVSGEYETGKLIFSDH
jgi:hypothetical protein